MSTSAGGNLKLSRVGLAIEEHEAKLPRLRDFEVLARDIQRNFGTRRECRDPREEGFLD